jgi:hypothetical protein
MVPPEKQILCVPLSSTAQSARCTDGKKEEQIKLAHKNETDKVVATAAALLLYTTACRLVTLVINSFLLLRKVAIINN